MSALRTGGACIEEITLPVLAGAAALQRNGGLSAAESWTWHRRRLTERERQYDPCVALRIRRGEAFTAADYLDLLEERCRWIASTEAAMAGFDALLSPTVPIVAPRLQSLIDDDDAFFAANALLLRNPSLVNLLDEVHAAPPDPKLTWMTSNEPDSGFLGTLSSISAEMASRAPAPGMNTIAAHTGHLCYSMSLANRAFRGEDAYANADWKGSWCTQREVCR